jgi:hypothetical protein
VTDLVCVGTPAATLGAEATTFTVGRAVLAADEGAGEAGSLEAWTGAQPTALTVAPGAVTTTPAPAEQGVVLRGRQDQARGLFGWRLDGGEVAPCQAPRSRWWFGNAGAGLDHTSVVIVTNADPGPAVVDLRVLTQDGEADVSLGGRGVTIEPGQTKRIELDELAPGADDAAVSVSTTRGRVAVFVADKRAQRGTNGFDWVPAQESPARELWLPGIQGAAVARILWLANPSDSEAVATLETATAQGRFVPAEIAEQTVAPGAILAVELSGITDPAYTLRVTSDEPVIGGVRSVGEDGSLIQIASAPTLDGPGAVPVVGATSLQLSAGAQDATALLRAYDAQGALQAEESVELSAISSTTWQVPNGAAYVVVVPQSGPLVAAAVYPRAVVPVQALPLTVTVPPVRPAG